MAKHKFQQALARLLREIVQLFKTLTGKFVRWFLRNILVTKRWQKGQAGFVLPTIAFMLMVVALVVAAILFRTFTRTEQLVRENQQQAIVNAASPAVDRAKSKIEFLFADPTLPRDIPTEKSLEELLLDKKYEFADEEPVNLSGITGLDVARTTAWQFKTDTTGNGKTDDPQDVTTIYAILARSARDTISIDPDKPTYNKDKKARAAAFVMSGGPLVGQSGNLDSQCPISSVAGNPVGWFNKGSNSAAVYKNFQVYAVTVPNALTQSQAISNATIATIEYQQDRSFSRANKLGAWFRTDLEIAPGPRFNWNGAMHSQGNIIVRSQEGFRSYMISSESSCVYQPLENSAITLRNDKGAEGGQFLTGQIRLKDLNPQKVWIHTDPDALTEGLINRIAMKPNSIGSSDKDGDSQSSLKDPSVDDLIKVTSDPLSLHTKGISEPRIKAGAGSWNADEDNFWNGSPLTLQGRVTRKNSCAPYVDDMYRADNRYGPKPSYDKENPNTKTEKCEAKPFTEDYGSLILDTANNATLRRDDSPGSAEGEAVGLDGYWERRARFNGLRLIVGQRLELGNPFGWNVDLDNNNPTAGDKNFINDPANPDQALYPPTGVHPASTLAGRSNEGRQYTTLRDNLAAVQTTAVYHHTHENGYFPIAFIATTAHPGTTKTIQDSVTFRNPATGNVSNIFNTKPKSGANSIFTDAQFGNEGRDILSNFFIGEGTNGWEFNVVPGTGSQKETDFNTVIGTPTAQKPLMRALQNLAHFAGDPEGYFPPKQESGLVHPYPKLTMWGNFSNLRETLKRMETTTYEKLSIADKSNIHTAAGTLGMLAYNISYLQEFDYSNSNNQKRLDDSVAANWDLDKRLQELSDADTIPGSGRGNGEIEINKSDATQFYVEVYKPGSNASSKPAIKVPIPPVADSAAPPEAFIAAMEAIYEQTSAGADKDKALADLQLTKLLHLKEQVERDRKFGFRNTPVATGSIAVNDADLPYPTTTNFYFYKVKFQGTSGSFKYAGVTYDDGKEIAVGCNLSDSDSLAGGSGNNFFGFGDPALPASKTAAEKQADEQRFIRLATSICPTQPKFPSLYYLFPKYSHDHDGDTVTGATFPGGVPAVATDYLQPGNSTIPAASRPPAEPYIADSSYIAEPYITKTEVNGDYSYQVVSTTAPDDFSGIALLPRTIANATCKNNEWCLPKGAASGAANPINDQTTTAGASANAGVAFLDKGIFDGREMMNVRLLDVDLDLLRKTDRDGVGKQDVWLPKSGIVYGFREDAVREDAIARPALTTWSTYETDWKKDDGTPGDPNTYRMQAGTTPGDPPLCQIALVGGEYKCKDASRGISPKPVDYYGDPDRRPYGFRLQNGVNLTRDRWDEGDLVNNLHGLSFISDNQVYIKGDFNLHLDPNTTWNSSKSSLLEEFDAGAKLSDISLKDDANFYKRFYNERPKSKLNTESFAQLAKDTWRPAEIIADAVGVLSSKFCDGTIQGALFKTYNECTDSSSSYRNSHFNENPPSDLRLATATETQGYVCENPFDIRTVKIGSLEVSGGANRQGCDGPVKVFRNGELQYNATSNIKVYDNYLKFSDKRTQLSNTAGPNWVNAVIVSGIVPSRIGQSNGGLVNFPRFLESWDQNRYSTNDNSSRELWFSGSMIQLNFSNYATAPWDQDAWETSLNPSTGNQYIMYYTPPLRAWGYDVGLQYAPAGPLARRMVTPERNRSELYREPPADDPYICKLRAQIIPGTKCN